MENLQITKEMAKPFEKLWQELTKNFNQSDIDLFYKVVPCKQKDEQLAKAIASNLYSTFHYFRMWGCAENIVFPIYMLNGKSKMGDFKVLTNDSDESLHCVIYQGSTNSIFDPTYEKMKDEKIELPNGTSYIGVEATFSMLGQNGVIMELEEYLTTYSFKNNSKQTNQIHDLHKIIP